MEGTRLGVYEIDSLLGSGGMGSVYLARHALLQRPCALKVLHPDRAEHDSEYLRHFREEGKAAAGLVHPNIITVHAIGEERGYHFLEMEYLPGGSLSDLIDRERGLTPVRATTLAVRVAGGLAAAHARNIIHRDLKPDNIMISQRGVPKITDFGLAKQVEEQPGQVAPGVAGTPAYMAPELFAGQPACPATDVYALGVTYYRLLAGGLPHHATTLADLIDAVLTRRPEPIPGLPASMADCLDAMLAKRRENRPADAAEALAMLSEALRTARDVDALLHEAFSDEQGIEWTREDGSWRLRLRFAGGRGQTVILEQSASGARPALLMIYSICGPARPEFHEQALRLNSEIPHGALAIREVNGAACFVMVDTYPLATVDVEAVRRSVIEVAERADAVENLLTGQDHH